LSLVGTTAFIIGVVLTLQSRPTLVRFGAEAWLPAMVSVSIIREIGPVLVALICAGKIGSGIGAELGSMKVTEQIDAMEVSGTNPFKYIVVTRIISTTLMIPLLAIMGDGIALYGSFLAVKTKGRLVQRCFFTRFFKISISAMCYRQSLRHSFLVLLSAYRLLQRIQLKNGTEGVGQSANSAVVVASLLVFVLDLIAVQITAFLDIYDRDTKYSTGSKSENF